MIHPTQPWILAVLISLLMVCFSATLDPPVTNAETELFEKAKKSPTKKSPTKGPSSSQLPLSLPRQKVHQHVRNLQGIVETLVQPSAVEDKTPWPFLGDTAMDYLRSHGYDTPSVLHIASIYQQAHSDEDFVNQLADKGLPVTEARFLYRIIDNKDADFSIVYYE